MSMWERPTFIQAEVHLLGNGPIIRYPRKQISKHILEVTQSTVGPLSLSSQHFGKHVFVTTNNLHGYAQAYIRSRAYKNNSIRQTDVVQGSHSRKENQELIQRFFHCPKRYYTTNECTRDSSSSMYSS
jgi:hypothetical protein